MKDSMLFRFWRKYHRRIIASVLVIAMLFSLINLGVFTALFGSDEESPSLETEPQATTEPVSTEPEQTLSQEESLELALTQLTQQIQLTPDDAELYIQRAAVNYNLGQQEAALEDYSKALTLEEDPQTRYLRAVVYVTSGNNQNAYEDLSVALQADGENRDYLSLMADTCNALKKYEQALSCLEALLQTEPENCVLLTLAGDACVYLGDFEKATGLYERALACYSQDAQESGISQANMYSAYGNCLKTLNYFTEAAQAYSNSLALEENKELYFQRGFCLLQVEDYEAAAQDFTQCIEQDYEAVYARFQRGLCYYAQGDHSAAIEDFKVYEEAYPDKTDTWLYMGLCYQTIGYYQSAISYYSKCIDAEISAGTCYYNIGNCYYNQQAYSSAIYNYTLAINTGSHTYEALLNRGISYIQLNKYNEAKADLKRVIDECPDYSLVASAQKSYDPIKNITIITKG